MEAPIRTVAIESVQLANFTNHVNIGLCLGCFSTAKRASLNERVTASQGGICGKPTNKEEWMILKLAVVTNKAKILQECKTLSQPSAKASVYIDSLLPIRLVRRDFSAITKNIFSYSGEVVSREDLDAFQFEKEWSALTLLIPERNIQRISNTTIPRLKRSKDAAPSTSLAKRLIYITRDHSDVLYSMSRQECIAMIITLRVLYGSDIE